MKQGLIEGKLILLRFFIMVKLLRPYLTPQSTCKMMSYVELSCRHADVQHCLPALEKPAGHPENVLAAVEDA